MENPISVDEIVKLICDFSRSEVNELKDRYEFTVNRRDRQIKMYLLKSEVDDISEKLAEMEVHEETALASEHSYEIIVREESSFQMRRFRTDSIEVKNEEAALNYQLSVPSDHYLVWLIAQMRRNLDPRDVRLSMVFSMRFENWLEEQAEVSPLDYIRQSSLRWLSLKIASEKRTTSLQFFRLTHAFLFQIGYNLDVALVPQRLLEEIVRHGRISRMRRSKIEELDPPRRTYNEDLVQHYLLAVSTDNPVIEYLSYYHIFEHFFEAVFNEDLVESIKSKITDPGFSYKRKKDINKLIASIKRSLQIRSETITFSEAEALKLCITKFVDIDELCQKLDEYDDSLVKFYASNEVIFAGGPAVNLRETDAEQVIIKLAKRIYATRNALVHSKDGDRGRYTPFKDDRVLVKEVPLLRFASEMVIISESTVQ